MHLRLFGGIDDFIITSPGFTYSNIFANGPFKKNRILKHHTDILAKHCEWIHTIINAVDSDRPLLNLIEARNELDESCFSPSGKTDKRYLFPRWNLEVDTLEDRTLWRVTENNVIEANLSSQLPRTIVWSLHF